MGIERYFTMKKQALLFVLLSSLVVTACNKGPKVEDLGTKEIHTDLMKQYLNDANWENIKEYVPYVSAETSDKSKLLGDISQPKPIELKFEEVEAADKYLVQIAKNVEFKDAKLVEADTKAYNFYNSEIGQEYYYRAAVSEEALAKAKVYKFKVSDVAPRYIHVDGVINFRDVGGWKTTLVANGVVKQGLYYRCAQFDDTNDPKKVNITAEGKATIKELGIKIDIDMRDRPRTDSPASSDDWKVEVLNGAVASGTESYRWEGKSTSGDDKIAKTYKKIFEAIANADVAPIALHCTHGADRTGIVSWFLLGLLGVSKEDCARDYVMTRFAGERAVAPNGSSSEIAKWNEKTEALEGATWADKTFKHLNEDFGIEADTLYTIREKFVPGYTRPAAA